MTRVNSPLASGEAISALAACEPADSPAIVTLAGSPPKAAMLRLTHLQRGDKVEHAVSARRAMVQFGGELGMSEETQRIEPMIKGDDDDASCRKMRAVVASFGDRAYDKAAAMNPNHRRQARARPRSSGRPDVEIEAILGDAGGVRIDVVPDDALQRITAEGMGRADARPGRNRLGRAQPKGPSGGPA